MAFQFGVTDVLEVGAFAWNLYRSCKGAPESFGNIASEVLSLHAVLKEAQEMVFPQPLSPTQQERLKAVRDGCFGVLGDLQNLIKKYESLGARSKCTWDRMRWGAEDIAGLRSRLTANTVLLMTWISLSQVSVKKKLNRYMQEVREGRRESSVISAQTIDSLSTYDKRVWRTIRKDLGDAGITVAAFDANKEFIIDCFKNEMARGSFGDSTVKPHESFLTLNDVEHNSQESLVLEGWTSVSQVPPNSPTKFIGPSNTTGATSRKDVIRNTSSVSLAPKVAWRPHVPGFSALIAGLTRPGESLIAAVVEGDLPKARKLMSNPTKLSLLDGESFSTAICWAAEFGRVEFVRLLLGNGADANAKAAKFEQEEEFLRILLENGADVNTKRQGDYTALYCASNNGHEEVVRLLLQNGADVNAKGEGGRTALYGAWKNGYRQIVRLLLENGADANDIRRWDNVVLHRASPYFG